MAHCPKCGFWVDCNCYAELRDKILAKIAENEDGDFECQQIVEELKSLLEDKK